VIGRAGGALEGEGGAEMMFDTWTEEECNAAERGEVPEELNLYDRVLTLITKESNRRIYFAMKIVAALNKIKADVTYVRQFDYIRRGDFIHETRLHKSIMREVKAEGLEDAWHMLVAYDKWRMGHRSAPKATFSSIEKPKEADHDQANA
jgi:hypothetical protein